MGRQGVVVFSVAERRRRAAGLVGRHDRPIAAGVDAGLHFRSDDRGGAEGLPDCTFHPGVVLPRLGPYPDGIATLLPGTGVALAQFSSSGSGASSLRVRAQPISAITSCIASRLWPETSASMCGSAAAIP